MINFRVKESVKIDKFDFDSIEELAFFIEDNGFYNFNKKNETEEDFDVDLKFTPMSELSDVEKKEFKNAKKYSGKLLNI